MRIQVQKLHNSGDVFANLNCGKMKPNKRILSYWNVMYGPNASSRNGNLAGHGRRSVNFSNRKAFLERDGKCRGIQECLVASCLGIKSIV